MSNMHGVENRGIYPDLMRKFRNEGHQVVIVTPRERRSGEHTNLTEVDGVKILGVHTLNLQKTSIIEKGVGQVLVESQFKNAIKKHLAGQTFDLILYSTPPITFPKVIAYLKRRNPQARTYLLLKDIFPQNAVDLGMMSKDGVKGLLYRFFRKKEKRLYGLSDFIGCMSPANVEYVLKHNPEIERQRVEVAPNSVEAPCPPKGEKSKDEAPCPPKGEKSKDEERSPSGGSWAIREKYGLPTDKPIFIYGGNLGKPQGIPFLISCLEQNKHRTDCHFVVIGNGTEYQKLADWYNAKLKVESLKFKDSSDVDSGKYEIRSSATSPKLASDSQPSTVNCKLNITVMKGLPKEDYDQLAKACDVGMIFLDHRFTIPNYPSRLLAYLENSMPVVCCTDPNTDVGRLAEKNGYGYWCESKNPAAFTHIVNRMLASDREAMGQRGYQFLVDNYTVDKCYDIIMMHFQTDKD